MIASPVRYRPECPEVLPAFLEAVRVQDYQGQRVCYALVQEESDDWEGYDGPSVPVFPTPWDVDRLYLPAPADSRILGGPRSTGETQQNLAYLRNRILREFDESGTDLLLMVDSDVILAPHALIDLVAGYQMLTDAKPPTVCAGAAGLTLSLQIDNRVFEDAQPTTNAQEQDEDGKWVPVPWSQERRFREVGRSGACTIYPRSVLARRFRWDPRYTEEHQGFFDDLRGLGCRHWLLQDPALVEHRMQREPSPRDELRRKRAEWDAANPGDCGA